MSLFQACKSFREDPGMHFVLFIVQYLLSVRPLQTDEQFERTKKMAKEFQDTIGRKLQRYLWLKSW